MHKYYKLILFCIFTLSLSLVQAQRNYAEAIAQGDAAFKNKDYKKAVNLYFTAAALDPAKKEIVKQRVTLAFEHIDSSCQKANKLVNSFYFYADRFALAFGNRVFYFIDKNGDPVPKLGNWQNAEQFAISGFAKVQEFEKDFLIDTFGNKYRVAYDIEDLASDVTALALEKKDLEAIPLPVFQHSQLQLLFLQGNHLQSLPAEIGNLQNLKRLNLAANQLDSLPEEIVTLKNLTNLNLNDNRLTSLPTHIGAWQNLKFWSLAGNRIQHLPAEIGALKNLAKLNLYGNRLSTLPIQIEGLQNLTSLELGGNPIQSLPDEISALKNLKSLSLQSSQLTAIPTQIEGLGNLTFLNLNWNRLQNLPEWIGNMKNLTDLHLYGNQLTTLSVQTGHFSNLKQLNLDKNLIIAAEVDDIKKRLPYCNIEYHPPTSNDYFVLGKYQEAYTLQKANVQSDTQKANEWYKLSWYALFVGQPKEAIMSAQKTLELDLSLVSVETNLALGYLLDNQWIEAEKIYMKWKGKNFPGDTQSCNGVFLYDIIELQKAGISHPDFSKAMDLLLK